MGVMYLNASDFDYSIHADKTTPYVKESVILTVDVNQTNHDIVLLFDFDLAKSEHYTFQRIDIKEVDAYHNVQIHYTYLIYPLNEGTVNIHFHLTQKATTDESVAYSFSGDRDNVKGLVTKDTKIALPPLALQVKPLPLGTQIVGDFNIDYLLKTLEAKAYEPLPLQVTLKGLGYPPLLQGLLPNKSDFTRFSEDPIVTSIATDKGTQSTIVYPMALSHDKSFTLSPIVINAFNPTLKKRYSLTVPKQHFNITPVDKSMLLDKIDAPKPFNVDWSWVQTLFGYLVVFAAGYLCALSWKEVKKQKHKEHHPLIEKIEKAKSEKELLQLLMSKESQDFVSCIEKLESSIYGDSPVKLKHIKKEALEKLL
jgi:hypothetical protein